MSPARVPAAQYYGSLPKSITGAGAVLHDDAGRFLLVQPRYRDDTWEIPGGAMQEGEFPWDSAHREVKEELGLDLEPGPLLVVDWVPAQLDARPALASFVFDGGRVTQQQLEQRVRLQADELRDWQLAGPDQWDQLLLQHLVLRLRACARALLTGTTAYLHLGQQPHH